jgi:hypothetical protein
MWPGCPTTNGCDDQLENRFEPLTLPLWEPGPETSSLLASFAASFPLRRPSPIATEEMMQYLLTRSEGTIGELARLLTDAAVAAIDSGEDAINQRTLLLAAYRGPTERRRLFERGSLGPTIQPTAPQRVYDGDPPSPYRTVWIDPNNAARYALDLARTKPNAARQLLSLITMGRRSRELHEREIAFLRRHGVPANFLPDTAELDRLFPTEEAPQRAGQPVTAAGRR